MVSLSDLLENLKGLLDKFYIRKNLNHKSSDSEKYPVNGVVVTNSNREISVVQSLSANSTMISGLSSVATSGSYNSLSDKPTKLSDFSSVGFTMSYSDITGKPSKLSEFTNDITINWDKVNNKPTKLSEFTNDITISWDKVNNRPTKLTDFSSNGFTMNYTSINNRPTKLTDFSSNGFTMGGINSDGTINSDSNSVNKVVVTDGSNNIKTISKLPLDNVTHQDISGKEDKSNKVLIITENSSDDEYPSAKAVYYGSRNELCYYNGVCEYTGGFNNKKIGVYPILEKYPYLPSDCNYTFSYDGSVYVLNLLSNTDELGVKYYLPIVVPFNSKFIKVSVDVKTIHFGNDDFGIRLHDSASGNDLHTMGSWIITGQNRLAHGYGGVESHKVMYSDTGIMSSNAPSNNMWLHYELTITSNKMKVLLKSDDKIYTNNEYTRTDGYNLSGNWILYIGGGKFTAGENNKTVYIKNLQINPL